MPKNYSNDRLEKRLENIIIKMQKDIRELRTNQTTWQGYAVFPIRTSDPPVTKTGQAGLYYNSNTNKWRKSVNGGAWADTTI